MSEQWPEMAETEYDADGVGVPGTYPHFEVVSLGAYGKHNEPFPSVRMAGCAYCNRWAVGLYLAQKATTDGSITKAVERRLEMKAIYACDQHIQQAADELVDEYGYATNRLDLDLAMKVAEGLRLAD